MEYVYAALLLHKLAKPVDEDGIKKIVSAAGVKPDDVKVKALVSALGEVNIDEALKNASMAATAAPVAAATTAPAAEGKKQEAPKEEKPAEEALEGLSSLFG
ncbi:MAG: 50S ribosomal protein P1 [Thaumarchaeota archaeon]|nr:50S ribosomal protein P1 [Nitrososphaerota archaeon]